MQIYASSSSSLNNYRPYSTMFRDAELAQQSIAEVNLPAASKETMNHFLASVKSYTDVSSGANQAAIVESSNEVISNFLKMANAASKSVDPEFVIELEEIMSNRKGKKLAHEDPKWAKLFSMTGGGKTGESAMSAAIATSFLESTFLKKDEIMAMIKAVLQGGIENIHELVEIMRLVGLLGISIDTSLLQDIQEALADFIEEGASNAGDIENFKQFIDTVSSLVSGVVGGLNVNETALVETYFADELNNVSSDTEYHRVKSAAQQFGLTVQPPPEDNDSEWSAALNGNKNGLKAMPISPQKLQLDSILGVDPKAMTQDTSSVERSDSSGADTQDESDDDRRAKELIDYITKQSVDIMQQHVDMVVKKSIDAMVSMTERRVGDSMDTIIDIQEDHDFPKSDTIEELPNVQAEFMAGTVNQNENLLH